MANERAAGPRWLDVAPDRIAGWLDSFAARHGGLAGPPETAPPGRAEQVTFRAADGTAAECHPPFPPLPPIPGAAPAAAARALAAHAGAPRTVGVLLVRLGGYAAGVFGPGPDLLASKVGSRLVHGRSAAGGQSQQRFARRREKQSREALGAAADCAAAVLGPFQGRLDAVVLGGDRRAVAGLAGDPRLRPYFALADGRFLTVPDPRLAVLKATPRQFRAIRVLLVPGGGAAGAGR
jgi:Actinobacteria/chloroflexi VLRF1 release factor